MNETPMRQVREMIYYYLNAAQKNSSLPKELVAYPFPMRNGTGLRPDLIGYILLRKVFLKSQGIIVLSIMIVVSYTLTI